MKAVLAGGSGRLGSVLAQAFRGRGDEVLILSRQDPAGPSGQSPNGATVYWDGVGRGSWVDALEGADVLINLAGRSVNCRYSVDNRRAILDSRVLSTRALAKALRLARNPPLMWLQMSTATIYAHRFDGPNDEATGVGGGGGSATPKAWSFSVEVAKAWEAEALRTTLPNLRTQLLRTAVVMSPDPGGAFDILLGLVRKGLGGTAGNGRQYVSWIHEADFVRAVFFLIERDLAGPVNLAAPYPLPNARFMADLRAAWGSPFGLPSPRWMLEIGAFFLRTETELILKSRRVVPGRLLDHGFEFEFPVWRDAARDLCERWKASR